MTDLLFYLFAALAVAGALGMLLNVRNTVAGALSLVGTMVSLGAIYVLLDAYLIGVLQILVYAGAILVVFLFVVMLLNLRQDDFGPTVALDQAARRGPRGAGRGAAPGGAARARSGREIPADFGGYRVVAPRSSTPTGCWPSR